MLLEAGYLEQAIERLEDAIAINPNVRTARWEIARAYALEGRWAESDQLVAALNAMNADRPITRARYAWWRRDIPTLIELREAFLVDQQLFMPGLMSEFISIFVEGNWPARREQLLAVLDKIPPNQRRRAFVAQLVVEAAGFSGDVDTAIAQIERAILHGLYDLHWLDKCPLLDGVRADPRFAPLRARVKRRADGILDALYGDHHLGTSETAIAT
jgi:serine/threonine-protein kinase